jgi:hypothetical protein
MGKVLVMSRSVRLETLAAIAGCRYRSAINRRAFGASCAYPAAAFARERVILQSVRWIKRARYYLLRLA